MPFTNTAGVACPDRHASSVTGGVETCVQAMTPVSTNSASTTLSTYSTVRILLRSASGIPARRAEIPANQQVGRAQRLQGCPPLGRARLLMDTCRG
jgi:hypothetical protein